mmetsp:Transcript_22227/g.50903  ORF Transcript_22227/g.50903 Transcript_22227/m.50903 type:complete len:90 (+) Transcript_22227:364-633(+)
MSAPLFSTYSPPPRPPPPPAPPNGVALSLAISNAAAAFRQLHRQRHNDGVPLGSAGMRAAVAVLSSHWGYSQFFQFISEYIKTIGKPAQ